MISFAGWEMPVQFSGLMHEHKAVRENIGVFDISHMGVLRLEGANPKDALQTLVPTDLHRIGPGEACYTVLINERGCILDDLIVYDLGPLDTEKGALMLIINSACINSDTAWIKEKTARFGLSVKDVKADGVLLALQGPEAISKVEELSSTDLSNFSRFGHRELIFDGLKNSVFTSRTGYTGEDGVELILSSHDGQILWEKLINQGVTPCGLGARDTLRLEAAMHLYGQDITDNTNPFEAGLGWLVHLEIPSDFIGRNALEHAAETIPEKRLVGLKLQGRAIARHDYPVLHNGKCVGIVTSGTWSPTLQEAIALAYVPQSLAKIDTDLTVEIRGKNEIAKVVKKPFYRRA